MIIYTDGSCRSNGNPDAIGGFGVVAVDEEKGLYTYAHQEIGTTNNRQELKAVLYAMLNFGEKDFFAPTVYCDSAYVVNTFNDWMFRWADNNWKTSTNKTPENLDLIQNYYEWYQKGYRINLQKIKGHSGNKWNELADRLATGKEKASYEWRMYGDKYY